MIIKSKVKIVKQDGNRYAFGLPDGDKIKWVSAFLQTKKYREDAEAFNEHLREIQEGDEVEFDIFEKKGFWNIRNLEKIEKRFVTPKEEEPEPKFLEEETEEEKPESKPQLPKSTTNWQAVAKKCANDESYRQALIVAQSSLKEAVNFVEMLAKDPDNLENELLRVWQVLFEKTWEKLI